MPVRTVAVPANILLPESYAAPVPGAVQPVWITVRIPADTPPGEYHGTVAVRAEGLTPTDVPLHLTVIDWCVPDPPNFVVHHNIYQSHDSVARYYQVPLWSDRHFELMGKSLALTREAGNKLCVVHLIADAFCMGNAESMVRWVKPAPGGDGTFSHDYTVFDRYLDLYEKTVGKPGLVLLSVWARGGDGDRTISFGKEIEMPAYARRPRHTVTLLDPATGRVEPLDQPPYGTPESVAFWRPVLTGVRVRLEKRGWFGVTAIGSGGDAVPLPTTVSGFKEIWPDGRWMSISHTNPTEYRARDGSTVSVGYSEHVWGAGHLYDPDSRAARARAGGGYPAPWSRGASRIEWGFPRIGIGFIDHLFDSSPVVAWRFASEGAIQGNLNGVGRIGADFWPVPVGNRGKCDHITGTTNLGPAYSTLALLSPGPDGAIPTERYEMFCEGVQVAEAVIAVKKALETRKLPPDLARRGEALLDQRARRYYQVNAVRKTADDLCNWKVLEAAGWQTADEQLFTLAAEMVGELAGR